MVVLLAAALGCRDTSLPPKNPVEAPEPTTQPAASEKTGGPEIPIDADQNELVSNVIIKDTTVADRLRTAKYQYDAKTPGGGILGLCYIPFDKPVVVPKWMYLAVEGDNAIKTPEPGEAAYYRTHMPRRSVLLGDYDDKRKRYGVGGTVIIVRDVKAGPRKPLERAAFTMDYDTGQLVVPKAGYNYSSGSITFVPTNERVQFNNSEFYACDLVIRNAADKAVFQSRLDGYSDPKFPGQRYGTNFNMVRPKLRQSTPIKEPGTYVITDIRHPWLKAYVFAVENPYVALSGEDGLFRLDGLPEGKYTLDIWNTDFEPEQSSREVAVAANKTEEMLVRFKPPKLLTDPPALPETTIKQWAFIGPFEVGRKSYPPEEKLDLKGAYTTEYKYANIPQPMRWQAAGSRLGHYHAVAFFYTTLNSPKAQKVRLGFGAFCSSRGWEGAYVARSWVNGELIYTGNRQGRNSSVIPFELRAGKNDLLVRLDTYRYNSWCDLVVTYEAEGVTDSIPDALKPKTGK